MKFRLKFGGGRRIEVRKRSMIDMRMKCFFNG
jgi:hypothetical protein